MAFAFIASVTGTVSSGTSPINIASFTPTVSASQLLVINILFTDITNTITSITDNKGNTYSLAVGPIRNTTSARTAYQFYSVITTSGITSLTITWSGSSSTTFRAFADSFSGNATSGVFHVGSTKTATAGGTSSSVTSFSPASGELISAMMASGPTSFTGLAVGSGYTFGNNPGGTSGTEYKLSSSTTETAPFTWTSPSQQWVEVAGAYKIKPPSFSTFADPLSASTQNTTLWGGNFGTESWTGGGWTITNPINYTGYGGSQTNSFYDLTGTSVYCSVANLGSTTLASAESIPLGLVDSGGTNKLFWYMNLGTIAAWKDVAGTSASIASATYSATTMKWFSIAEGVGRKSGTGVTGTTYFEYSADGITWTQLTSATNPIAVTTLAVNPSLGTFSNEASSTTMKINSFNTPATTNGSVTQVAANITATGGTQAITVPINASVTQVVANVSTSGGTQSVATVNNINISQLAATLTASTGTQSIATVNIVSISQIATILTAAGGSQGIQDVQDVQIAQVGANVTASGGMQSTATVNSSTVIQVGSTITATGGTQTVASAQAVSISQGAANLTITGGTQSVSTGSISNASITQIAAVLTVTAGGAVVTSLQDVSITQLAASLTATGGTQFVATTNFASIAQSTANLTSAGGTQSISAIGNTTVSQVGSTLTATGGTQSLMAQIDAVIAQQAANLISGGGTQTVNAMSGIVDGSVTQIGANLTVSGGTQIVSINSSPLPPRRTPNPIFLLDGRIAVRLSPTVYLPL